MADCLACHAGIRENSHPLGVRPPPGSGLPAAESGGIDCLTCHDEGVLLPRHATRPAGTGLIRLEGRALCNRCHDAVVRKEGRVIHGGAAGTAHLSSRDAALPAPGLDVESRRCLYCHDGLRAPMAATRDPHWMGSLSDWSRALEGQHPVGVEYPDRPAGARRPQYQPRESLPAGVRLVNGKVGCGSCHSVYSQRPALLSAENRGGMLCLACHIK